MSKLKVKMQSDLNQEVPTMQRTQDLTYQIEAKKKEIAMQKRSLQTLEASMQRIISENEQTNLSLKERHNDTLSRMRLQIQKINDMAADSQSKNEHLQKRKAYLAEVINSKQESWKELSGFQKVINDKTDGGTTNKSEKEMVKEECLKI